MTNKMILMMCIVSSTLCIAEPWRLAVLGDSISVASQADGWGASPQYGWATGMDIRSVVVRMREAGANAIGVNVAESGAVMEKLPQQALELVDTVEDLHQVMILMGHNDVCGWDAESQDQYQGLAQNLRTSLRILIDHFPGVQIHVLGFLNIERARELGVDRGFCQLKWDVSGFCSQFLHSSRTNEERARFLGWWSRAQQIIQRVTEEFEQASWLDETTQIDMHWEHVSDLDCVHPSIRGQELLAHHVWERLWGTR